MKNFLFSLIFLFISLSLLGSNLPGEHPTLAIGAKAPDFHLPGVDGKTYSLSSFAKSRILVIAFTCNHCPTAQAYEDRLIQLVREYSEKGIAFLAIMPNDPKAIRLDELGYTDLGDSFEEMKIRARDKNFNFPYLYDGETEEVSRAYGPQATPHIFIFDQNRKLAYSGRIDDVENPKKTPHTQDTRNALEDLLQGKTPRVSMTKVFGCSIKWSEKEDWKEKAKADWANEPVHLDTLNPSALKELMQNKSDKLRMINIWATWCGPCLNEFSDILTLNRMYRRRDFEIITISSDDPLKAKKALKFLTETQASTKNYIFNRDDKYALIEGIDPNWKGALPYTLLVEPGGKIVYSLQGPIDLGIMKKVIVDNPLIGRYY